MIPIILILVQALVSRLLKGITLKSVVQAEEEEKRKLKELDQQAKAKVEPEVVKKTTEAKEVAKTVKKVIRKKSE